MAAAFVADILDAYLGFVWKVRSLGPALSIGLIARISRSWNGCSFGCKVAPICLAISDNFIAPSDSYHSPEPASQASRFQLFLHANF